MLRIRSDEAGKSGGGARRFRPLGDFSGSLANRTYLTLRDSIISLQYRPGEPLRKGVICETLGISRSPVSEAIARLAQEGLVNVVPQAGTYISLFSMEKIREGAFLREAIELAAAEYVAGIVTDSQITQLRRNLKIQKALIEDGDISGFYQMDREMHEMILSFTGYRKLNTVANSAWAHVDRARQLILPVEGRPAEAWQEHQVIVTALETRDPPLARSAMRHHLGQLMTFLAPLERDHPDLFDPS